MAIPTERTREASTASGPVHIATSVATVTSVKEGVETVRRNGWVIAPFPGDTTFFELKKHGVYIMGSKGLPETSGWHKRNKKTGVYEQSNPTDVFVDSEWYERIFVSEPAKLAISKGEPIVVDIGKGGSMLIDSDVWHGWNALIAVGSRETEPADHLLR